MRCVKARIIEQTSKAGEVNLQMVLDPLTPLEDFTVKADGWEKGTVKQGELLIVASDEVLANLLNREFRSVL